MKLRIEGATDAFVTRLLPLLNTPAVLVDFRVHGERTKDWQGDDLPVFHSLDALAGLCDWEDALYDTNTEDIRYVIAPPKDAALPEEKVLPDWSDVIYLTDEGFLPPADQVTDAGAGHKKCAALWNQEQGILDRLLQVFKGKTS